MKDRLAHALELRGLEPMDLVRAIQKSDATFSKQTVYWILDGKTKPETVRAATLFKICDVLSINPRWLLNAKGAIDAASASGQSQSAGLSMETILAGVELLQDYVRETELPLDQTHNPAYLAAAISAYAEADRDTPIHIVGIRFGEKIREIEKHVKSGEKGRPAAGHGGSNKRTK